MARKKKPAKVKVARQEWPDLAQLQYTGYVAIEAMWRGSYGVRWAFLWIDGRPWLASEEDAR